MESLVNQGEVIQAGLSLLLCDHQPASKFPLPPACREGFRNFEPAPITSGTVMHAHARALAFMTLGILAGRRADLVLEIRLNNIEATVFFESAVYEIVEPGFRYFPESPRRNPARRGATHVLQPSPVGGVERQADPEKFAFPRAPQDDWDILLISDSLDRSFHSRPR